MIQRIQSLYLLIVAALMTVLAFFPLATLTSGAETAVFDVWQIAFPNHSPIPLWYFGGTVAATGFLAVVVLGLYKKRKLQLRLTYVLMILAIGVVVFTGLYGVELYTSDAYTVDFSPLVLLPLFCLPLVWLARKGIIRDIALLESYERMR